MIGIDLATAKIVDKLLSLNIITPKEVNIRRCKILAKALGMILISSAVFAKTGWLGVYTQELTKPMKLAIGVDYGVLVTEVITASPAEDGGIQVGDILMEINGEKIQDFGDLKSIVEDNPEKKVDIKIYRERAFKTLSLKLGEREEARAEEWEFVWPPYRWPEYKGEIEELKREIRELQKNLRYLFKELKKEYKEIPRKPPKPTKRKFKLKKFFKEILPEEIEEI